MKTPILFSEYRTYCQQIENSLNNLPGYSATYRTSGIPFLKQHDGEYLEIVYQDELARIKINLCYSLPYQMPVFYFMVYDQSSRPLSANELYERYIHQGYHQNSELQPTNMQHGVYLSQNPITKQYFYTLHHCDLTFPLDKLVPFYLSLIRLHPPLIISSKYSE